MVYYFFKVYLIQSIAAILLILLLYGWFSIFPYYIEYIHSENHSIVSNVKYSLFFVWLTMEFLVIPLNSIYLSIVNKLSFNKVNFNKQSNIVLFSFVSYLLVLNIEGIEFVVNSIFNHICTILKISTTSFQISSSVRLLIVYIMISVLLVILNLIIRYVIRLNRRC